VFTAVWRAGDMYLARSGFTPLRGWLPELGRWATMVRLNILKRAMLDGCGCVRVKPLSAVG